MIDKLARIVSVVFHPLWIPTFLFAIIFRFTPSLAAPINQEIMPRMLLVIFALTGIIPVLTLTVMRLPHFILMVRIWAAQLANGGVTSRSLLGMRAQIEMSRKQSIIQSFSLENRTERVLPFFIITVFYLAVSIMMSNRMGWDNFFMVALMTITGISFLVTLVTLKWKISVHSVAVSSVVGFLLATVIIRAESALLYPLVVCILAAGSVMSARLRLNIHTPSQVGWGCLLGFSVSFVVAVVYL